MKNLFISLMLFFVAVLNGCGGGGGGGAVVHSIVSGTVSQGAALASGTTVTIIDAKKVAKTTTVGTNGAYSIVVDSLTEPFVINAGGFYSFAAGPGVTNDQRQLKLPPDDNYNSRNLGEL